MRRKSLIIPSFRQNPLVSEPYPYRFEKHRKTYFQDFEITVHIHFVPEFLEVKRLKKYFFPVELHIPLQLSLNIKKSYTNLQ